MAFDAKAFAAWNTKTRFFLREMLRREKFHQATPNLGPVWVVALSELTNLTQKVADGMFARLPEEALRKITLRANPEADPHLILSLSLIKRLREFPLSLSYQVNEDGTVLLYSSDRYLEGALYFGTRQLPRLRPIDFLVSRMALRLQDPSIVFIARDFRKSHEIDQEFKRENLRKVSPHYS